MAFCILMLFILHMKGYAGQIIKQVISFCALHCWPNHIKAFSQLAKDHRCTMLYQQASKFENLPFVNWASFTKKLFQLPRGEVWFVELQKSLVHSSMTWSHNILLQCTDKYSFYRLQHFSKDSNIGNWNETNYYRDQNFLDLFRLSTFLLIIYYY